MVVESRVGSATKAHIAGHGVTAGATRLPILGDGPFWTLPPDALFGPLQSSAIGLTTQDSAKRLQQFGANRDAAPKHRLRAEQGVGLSVPSPIPVNGVPCEH